MDEQHTPSAYEEGEPVALENLSEQPPVKYTEQSLPSPQLEQPPPYSLPGNYTTPAESTSPYTGNTGPYTSNVNPYHVGYDQPGQHAGAYLCSSTYLGSANATTAREEEKLQNALEIQRLREKVQRLRDELTKAQAQNRARQDTETLVAVAVIGNPQTSGPPRNAPVVSRGSTTHIRNRPTNLTCLAVLVCLCCFWPLGIVAIHYAQKADIAADEGKYEEAEDSNSTAKLCIAMSCAIGIVCVVAITVTVAVITGA